MAFKCNALCYPGVGSMYICVSLTLPPPPLAGRDTMHGRVRQTARADARTFAAYRRTTCGTTIFFVLDGRGCGRSGTSVCRRCDTFIGVRDWYIVDFGLRFGEYRVGIAHEAVPRQSQSTKRVISAEILIQKINCVYQNRQNQNQHNVRVTHDVKLCFDSTATLRKDPFTFAIAISLKPRALDADSWTINSLSPASTLAASPWCRKT